MSSVENGRIATPLGKEARLSGSPGSRRRALIVKFGSIGDVIMAIPGAAALHQQGYTIDWLASESVAPLLRLYPWIQVLPLDEPRLLRGSYPQRLQTWLALRRTLSAAVKHHGPYHTVATLYYDRRYRWLTSFLSAQRRVSLSRTDRRFTLLPGRHHTDEYARILSDRSDGETPFQLAPVPVPTLPPSTCPLPDGRPLVVVVPAGARNALRDDALRRWPIDNYVELTRDLLRSGCTVALAGGPEDDWASPYFAVFSDHSKTAEGFHNFIGRLSLVETLSLMEAASVTVTHDTGPLHMAGLTSTAIVTIFGPTDPHGRLPRRNNAVALWGGEGFACRPCYDGRDYAPCTHNGCMSQVTPSMVAKEVQTLLRVRAEGSGLPPRVVLAEPAPFVHVASRYNTPKQEGEK